MEYELVRYPIQNEFTNISPIIKPFQKKKRKMSQVNMAIACWVSSIFRRLSADFGYSEFS